jgi:hypothetical protein
MKSAILGIAASICLATAGGAIAIGQDFRIDTEVFVGEEKEPLAETLTIFSNGYVYDFSLAKSEEITVFDPRRGKFTVLDAGRQMKMVVSTQEVLDWCLALSTHAVQSKDPTFAFAAQPTFEVHESSIEENGQTLTEVTLNGNPIVYSAKGKQPPVAESVAAFHDFANWYARLNALLPPGGLPPEARLKLNQALADRGLLPTEIKLTITPGSRFKSKLELRSRHLINWTLSGSDRKRLERTGDYLQTFQTVSFEQYCNKPAPSSERQARK